MILTSRVKLCATKFDLISLRNTLLRTNECCDWLAVQAWNNKIFSRYAIHYKFYYLARALQKARTRSAKRHLRKLVGKESNFARDVNHCISKKLVANAKGTSQCIALEDLTGIRERITVRRKQRAILHSWSFRQLRNFIEYKATLLGIPIFLVNPAYTSSECSRCQYVDKKNRKTRDKFLCLRCGFSYNADINAARVIASRAAIIKPIVTS